MRTALTLLTLVLSACGRIERERAEAAGAARAETLVEVERALARATRQTESIAGSANRTLSPMRVTTPAEIEALRRFPNAAHVARARALGVRAADDAVLDSLVQEGRLVALEDSTRHWIVRPGTAPTHVVPALRSLLTELGERFQARLAELDLPAYRIEVTSALRTAERQARLRETNSNAAIGMSAHEFGTTVDLSYAAFAPPLDPPDSLEPALTELPDPLRPYVKRYVDLAFESVSARKSRELGAIFSEVLRDAQAEGLVLVTYERQQTIYHITVARELGD